jgi:hypothetical protein
MSEPLPAPLTPPDCDLTDFEFMPLDVRRLRDSRFTAAADAEAFRAGVLLWCASWHQVPAASVPDDDVELAQLAGYGRVVKEWVKTRPEALHGWIRCSDGRLYHPVVAEKAREAWQAKLRQRWSTECARIKKHNDRHGTAIPRPAFEDWLSQGCPQGQPLSVPRDIGGASPGTAIRGPRPVPLEIHSKGQGQGQGEIHPLPPVEGATRAREAVPEDGMQVNLWPPDEQPPPWAVYEAEVRGVCVAADVPPVWERWRLHRLKGGLKPQDVKADWCWWLTEERRRLTEERRRLAGEAGAGARPAPQESTEERLARIARNVERGS